METTKAWAADMMTSCNVAMARFEHLTDLSTCYAIILVRSFLRSRCHNLLPFETTNHAVVKASARFLVRHFARSDRISASRLCSLSTCSIEKSPLLLVTPPILALMSRVWSFVLQQWFILCGKDGMFQYCRLFPFCCCSLWRLRSYFIIGNTVAIYPSIQSYPTRFKVPHGSKRHPSWNLQ